jgi:hypothetical protein
MHWRHQWRVAVLELAFMVLPSVAFVQAQHVPPPQPPRIDLTVMPLLTVTSSSAILEATFDGRGHECPRR